MFFHVLMIGKTIGHTSFVKYQRTESRPSAGSNVPLKYPRSSLMNPYTKYEMTIIDRKYGRNMIVWCSFERKRFFISLSIKANPSGSAMFNTINSEL
ncbi:hypothetical protein D3C76_1280280 [compost metagenome]